MDHDFAEILILEVKDPSHFTAKILLLEQHKAYVEAFQHWQIDMELIKDTTTVNIDVQKNEVYAVKSSDGLWKRVRVEQLMHTSKGIGAKCFYVDSGQSEILQLFRLYDLPEKYKSHALPFCVRTLSLWDLLPLSMAIEMPLSMAMEIPHFGFHTPLRPAKTWGTAAKNFFKELIQECDRAMVQLKKTDRNGTIHVILFLEENGEQINVNERLIGEEYACRASTVTGTDPDNSRCDRPHSAQETRSFTPHLPVESTPSPVEARSFTPHSPVEARSFTPHSPVEARSFTSHSPVEARSFTSHSPVEARSFIPHSPVEARSFIPHSARERKGSRMYTTDGPHSPVQAQEAQGRYKLPSSHSDDVCSEKENNLTFHSPNSAAVSQHRRWANGDVAAEDLRESVVSSHLQGSDVEEPINDTVMSADLMSDVGVSKILTKIDHYKKSPNCATLNRAHMLRDSTSDTDSGDMSGAAKECPSSTRRFQKAETLVALQYTSLNTHEPSVPKPPLAVSHGVVMSQGGSTCPDTRLNKLSAADSTVVDNAKAKRTSPSRELLLEDLSSDSDSNLRNSVKPSSVSSFVKSSTVSMPLMLPTLSSSELASAPNDTPAANACNKGRLQNPAPAGASNINVAAKLSETSSVLTPTIATAALVSAGRGCGLRNVYSEDIVAQVKRCQIPLAGVTSTDGQNTASADSALLAESEQGKTQKSPIDRYYDNWLKGRASVDQSIVYLTRAKLRGKAAGQLLLERLGGLTAGADNAAPAGVGVPLVWRPDRPAPDPFLGTMVFGSDPPPPVYKVDQIPFDPAVKAFMQREGFTMPRSVQANTWSAILRGENVIGIGPPHCGLTTAYLPAVVSELMQFQKYIKLPNGGGPKAIILVSSCKKAEYVHTYLKGMLMKINLKVLKIYGCEDSIVMQVMRGCDILIATPHCLLRMLDSGYLDLARLCHLVLEGVELLVEHFTLQIKKIMSAYAEELQRHVGLFVPRQIMAFGSQWTPGVMAFCDYLKSPVLVFASRLEASVYGQVKQEVHMCFEGQRLTTLKELLEKVATDPHKLRHIVIATTDPNQVKVIAEVLKCLSICSYVIDPFSKNALEEVGEQVMQWRMQTGSSPVLVVTDDNVTELRVTSASIVIHFDLPNSVTKFGNRLALMLEHFTDRLSPKPSKAQALLAVSHLLVTEKMTDLVGSLHSFLLRSRTRIPPSLESLIAGLHEGANKDTTRPLCMQLKQFGSCRDQRKCESRHLFLPCDYQQVKGQESWPPVSGCVRLRVLRVVDASHMYVMLLEHQREPGIPKEDLQHLYTELTLDLAMVMAQAKNQQPYCLEQGHTFSFLTITSVRTLQDN